jgi:hypothetical protein
VIAGTTKEIAEALAQEAPGPRGDQREVLEVELVDDLDRWRSRLK